MYNHFARYEQDFKTWIDAGYPDVNPLTRDFLEHLSDPNLPRKLWNHQSQALLRTIYAYELLHEKKLLLNIVTGGGKTAIIGAVIAWLKLCHDIQKFLVLCPNTIVRDRLQDDLRDGKVFREFRFFPPGCEHFTNELALHLMEAGAGPQGILESGIVLGNIHQLYQTNISGQRNLAYLMRYAEELAIFNDEAHNTPAPEYDNVLFALSPKSRFRLDTTATPDRADGKTPDSRMIFDYSITDAQAEVPPIIKNVVVYQPTINFVQLTYTNPDTGEKRTVDEMDEEFEAIEKGLTATQWVTDPDPMYKQMQIALARLEEQKQRAKALAGGSYRPILFVVAICIKDAEAARDMLEKQFGLKTLLVTEKSDEEDREAARHLGKPESDYEAVVSVLMLREGWDVPAVSVILLLRKFSSRVYGQQVVGRGLRRNVRERDIGEICAIVDHEKLQHDWLWEMVGAKVHKEVDQHSLFGDEDLPPPRKAQVLAHPENLIEIPEAQEEDEADFTKDFEEFEISEGDYPNWKEILDSFVYGSEVEIDRVEYNHVEVRRPGEPEFVELIESPKGSPVKVAEEEISQEELAESLTRTVRDIAAYLLAEEGVGSHELGYLYGVLIDHVRTKLLDGASPASAPPEALKRAIHMRTTVQHNIKDKCGLTSSIVKYKSEAQSASQ
jgi:type III restriction enzyme